MWTENKYGVQLCRTSQQAQLGGMLREVLSKHPDVLHECSANFSAVLELCTYAVVELHLSHKVYVYHQTQQ
jgi:hypothetical protein